MGDSTLAARKVLALFDRAEARDFVDVHTLSQRFDLDDLLDLVGGRDRSGDGPPQRLHHRLPVGPGVV